MGITGSVAGITGSIIESENSGSLIFFIVIVLAVIGVGFYLMRKKRIKKK